MPTSVDSGFPWVTEDIQSFLLNLPLLYFWFIWLDLGTTTCFFAEKDTWGLCCMQKGDRTTSMPKHAIKENVRCPFAQASNGKWLRWELLDQQQWSDPGNPNAKTLSKPPGNMAVQKAATQVLMVTIITKPLNLSSENYDHRERLLYWLFFL